MKNRAALQARQPGGIPLRERVVRASRNTNGAEDERQRRKKCCNAHAAPPGL
jgi:hypothetical protein